MRCKEQQQQQVNNKLPRRCELPGKMAHCGMRCTACSMNSATCLVMFSSALRCGKLSPPLSIAKQISHVFSLIMSVWGCVHTDLDNFRLQGKGFTRLTTLSWVFAIYLKKLPFILRFPTHLIEKVLNKYVSLAQSSRATQVTRGTRSPLIFYKLPYTGPCSNVAQNRARQLIKQYLINLDIWPVFCSFRERNILSDDFVPSELRSLVVYRFVRPQCSEPFATSLHAPASICLQIKGWCNTAFEAWGKWQFLLGRELFYQQISNQAMNIFYLAKPT